MVTVISGCALMATAGFSITTNGCTQNRILSAVASAMPLKNPATPIPSGIHIFSKREDTRSIKDKTGIDVMLPDGNGFDLMKQLKQSNDYPVLFLTACSEDNDKFRGFGSGADDYIVKPFLPKELLFRIMAILRRSYTFGKSELPNSSSAQYPLVQLKDSRIDFPRAEIIKCGKHIPLTAKEHALLSALHRNAGRIVTIDALCEAAWGSNPFGYENSLMAHIRRIREKIELNPSRPVSLVTVKGLGYKLIVEDK